MWPILALFALSATYSAWYVWYALRRGRIPANPIWRDGPPERASTPLAYWACVALAAFVVAGSVLAIVKISSWG